ncbi:hypothetical protein THAOC_17899, partial [Thalassiosira oceanica]
MTFHLHNELGKVDRTLLAVAVCATVGHGSVASAAAASGGGGPLGGVVLDKLDQHRLRLYLSHFFGRKLTKLLQSLGTCLKDHFNSVQLWTRLTEGGLGYGQADGDGDGGGGSAGPSSSRPQGRRHGVAVVLRRARLDLDDGGRGAVLLHGAGQLRPDPVRRSREEPQDEHGRRGRRRDVRRQARGLLEGLGCEARPLAGGLREGGGE